MTKMAWKRDGSWPLGLIYRPRGTPADLLSHDNLVAVDAKVLWSEAQIEEGILAPEFGIALEMNEFSLLDLPKILKDLWNGMVSVMKSGQPDPDAAT